MRDNNKIIVLNEYRTSAQEKSVDSVEANPMKADPMKASDAYNEECSVSEEQDKDGRVKRRKRIRVRRLKRIVGVFLICLALFFISGLSIFQIQTITVRGAEALSTEKVLYLSGIEAGDNLFWCNTREAKKQLRNNPFVENVSIRRLLPNTIVIQITEREPVGYIVTSDGYVQVDKDGRLLAIQQTLSNYKLPVISGVRLDELPDLGGVIQNEKLKQALEILQNCDMSLLHNIAELNVGQEYYILLYTNQQLEVRLGGLENLEQRLKDLNRILTEVVGTKIASDQILYIDMRYENTSAVIKLRD